MALIRKYFFLGAGIALALGAIFAFLGVYDTNELPFFKRFVFWTATMVAGSCATAFAAPWVLQKALKDRHPVLQIVAVAAIVSVPVTVVLTFFNPTFGFGSHPMIWALQYFYVLVISLVVTSAGYVGLWTRGVVGGRRADAGSSPGEPPERKFLERLPVKYRGAALYAVSSEDHYLRIHTDRGEALILMRLADALRELDGADGLQVHRSWWVAKDGVADAARADGRGKLILKSGAEAPVSRSFVKDARQAGLF